MTDALVNAIAEMLDEDAVRIATELVEAGTPPTEILDACNAGMAVVGRRFEAGEYFVPELILAGEMLRQISDIVKPLLAGTGDVQRLEALADAARAWRDYGAWAGRATDALIAVGIPPVPWRGSLIEAPFDFMSDTMRAMKGIMLDLRQRPEPLLKAEEKAIRIQVEYPKHFKDLTGLTYTSIPLHRGSDGFMSIPMFEKFDWPQLRDMLLQLIDAGITPNVFYEGVWDQRLEYLAELPRGKTVGMFQSSDIFRVKEVLGDTMPIMGGMPTSLLRAGPISAIRERTHEVCERVRKAGGFVMEPTINEMEGCDPAMIEAWIGATREYGVYDPPAA